jgi:hypothetical protein
MHGLAPYFLGGLTAVVLMNCFATVPGVDPAREVTAARADPMRLTIAERSHKGDRLVSRAVSGPKAMVSAIEVVGLRQQAVVYRDRDGRVLFRSDPLSNVTLVAKDVVLPQVTIHDDQKIDVAPANVPGRTTEPAPLAAGCEPAVSPLAAPLLARRASRCVAANDGPVKPAAL